MLFLLLIQNIIDWNITAHISSISIIAVLLRLSSPAAFLRQPVQMSPEKDSLIQTYHNQLMDLRHITQTSALTLSSTCLAFILLVLFLSVDFLHLC